MSIIDFYFDIASPYSYFANCRLPAMAESYGYTLSNRPIDLVAAKLAAGNDGPSTVQIPPKLRYVKSDFMRWSNKYGVPFNFPLKDVPKGGFDSSRANKGVFFARERGEEQAYIDRVYSKTFGGGGFVGDEALLKRVAEEMGWSVDDYMGFVDSDEADRLYTESNKEAQARGVFGVPIMMIGDEMWFGNDRLDLLEEYLQANPADAKAAQGGTAG